MNLTETSKFVKKFFVVFGAIIFVYYLWILAIFPMARNFLEAILVQSDPPTLLYGNIEQLEFYPIAIEEGTVPDYVLNTKNGALPFALPKVLKVYKFKTSSFSYLASDRAMSTARELGFEDTEMISDLKGPKFIWSKRDTGSKLEIDTSENTIFLTTEYAKLQPLLKTNGINKEDVRADGVKILSKIGAWNDDLYKKGSVDITYGTTQGGSLRRSIEDRDVSLTRLDFYRKIEEYPIVGPEAKKPLLSIELGNVNTGKIGNVIRNPNVTVNFRTIEQSTKATYPIIKVASAWEAVKEGKGVIVDIEAKNSNPFTKGTTQEVSRIFVNNIYLAYYENKPQTTLQPIYVFEGNYTSKSGAEGGNLTIYYPAIDPEYVK